jgi:single-strand DNA-binding protein
MQIITAVGRVGKDAELRTLPNGNTKVANFSLAVDASRKGQDGKPETTWFDISLFGKLAEAVAKYITKGKIVAVSGEVSARAHEGKAYLRINADKVKLLGGGEAKPKEAPAEDYGWLGGNEEPF